MGSKSSKTALKEKEIIHPQLHTNTNPTSSPSSASKSDNQPSANNDFSLKSQSEINTLPSFKQLWLVRHGERMDEMGTKEASNWRQTCSGPRRFDPPLTKNGFKQATERGKLLLAELDKSRQSGADYPKCIYASPTERTIGTAVNIAAILKLPVVIVPGLASCAAAVKHGGLIKKNVTSKGDKNEEKVDDEKKQEDEQEADWELFLENYGWAGECPFLTKQEVLQTFGGKNGVEIRFDYQHIDKFQECVKRLSNECETNIILCVTHREGIRYLDPRLSYARIPYCGLAKYAFVPESETHSTGFAYFEDE